MAEKTLILGIESSCDETAAAVVADGREILSSIVSSQVELHRPYGGVVPEIACRAHLTNIAPIVDEALVTAGVSVADLDGVAVTSTPGLVGALLVGVSFAKGFCMSHDLPLVSVNHLEAHIYSSTMEHEIPYPFLCLVVSGGHTSLYLAHSPVEYELLGGTIDDAAGEAFDKVASLLGLSYPGGPAVEKAAESGDPQAVDFPRPLLRDKNRFEFSFSGVKTSVLYHLRGQDGQGEGTSRDPEDVSDVAASFQEAVTEVLVTKTIQAAAKWKVERIALGGGVACNGHLRRRFQEAAEEAGVAVYFPSPRFCTDNAAMIAGLGYQWFVRERFADLDLEATPRP